MEPILLLELFHHPSVNLEICIFSLKICPEKINATTLQPFFNYMTVNLKKPILDFGICLIYTQHTDNTLKGVPQRSLPEPLYFFSLMTYIMIKFFPLPNFEKKECPCNKPLYKLLHTF